MSVYFTFKSHLKLRKAKIGYDNFKAIPIAINKDGINKRINLFSGNKH